MSSDPGAPVRRFADLVGDLDILSPGGYAVDGLTPTQAVRPRDVDELREIIRAARAEQLALIPWGGGSQMGLGNLPASYDVAVDLTGINQVQRYDPDDMTMAVQAGCRLADLNQMLGENRQVLPVDASSPEDATIGGLIAVGASGPRRFGYGPLRDLIIGMTVLMADGTIATAGGQVVKNVTGFDMMRLHHGALGSLGIILSVNLKVIPKPQSERTVLATYPTLEAADRAARAVAESQLGVTALVVTNPAASSDDTEGWRIAVRCEAPPSAVVRQGERVAEVIRDGSSDLRIEEESEQSEEHWLRICQVLSHQTDSPDIGVRLGCAPSRLGTLAPAIDRLAPDSRVTLDYGSGLAYVRVEPGAMDENEQSSLFTALAEHADHSTVLTAPPGMKSQIDIFGPPAAGFNMVESLKATFDPERILNRGRYVGRL